MERPVRFGVLEQDDRELEIVHSLAKWKRYALGRYGFNIGEGLYTDMNAIRRDEETDNIHSIYVDQWDWEKVITREMRTKQTFRETVKNVYEAIRLTEKHMSNLYDYIHCILPESIFFITTEELEEKYPELSPKDREYEIAKLKGAVCIEEIGDKLPSGEPHDGRAPDYDDWHLNGDIIVYYPILDIALELSSMGIRVDEVAIVLLAGTSVGMRRVRFHPHTVRHVYVVDSSAAVLPDVLAVLLSGVRRALARVANVQRQLQRINGGVFPVAPFPPAERAPCSGGRRLGDVQRVLQQLGDGDGRRLRLAAVVVAGEHHRRPGRRELAHPADDQQHPLLSRKLAYVVRVGVGETERRPGAAVLQDCPCADAGTGGAPGLRPRNFRRLGKPERPGLQDLEPVGAVADRRCLAALPVSVAKLAYHHELWQGVRDVGRLVGADLLQSHDVEVDSAHQLHHVRLALVPGVRGVPVAILRPDVVRPHAHRRRGGLRLRGPRAASAPPGRRGLVARRAD